MKCFLCNNYNFDKIYFLKTKNILRCKNDGLFLASTTVASNYNTYGKEYFSNTPNSFNSSYFARKLLTIQQLTNNNSPCILDVGCGWGDFEEVLEKQKVPYQGIDINKEAIEICNKKGLNCKQISLDKLLNYRKLLTKNKQISSNKKPNFKNFQRLDTENWNLEFDCITLFQVIEHLKDPLVILESVKKFLKPRGKILITTPNNNSPLRKILGGRWSVYNESTHYTFFNQSTLQQTLKLAGFKNIQVKLDSARYLSLSYILNRLKIPASNFQILTSRIPILTDPFGDLIAIASL